ncbi:hypothetical protein LUZ60_016570 [Juncus effusus]|nr:hypothetical protein LUZ60_016570 [Juncus effusus]
MGFPVGYSDLLLPRLFLHLLLLLGTIRRCLLWFFRSVGLGDLLEFDEPPVSGQIQGLSVQSRGPEFKSVDEALPVIKFRELVSDSESECCAVCLHDITGEEEVRRLSNCTHVFHRGCIDRWIEHDQQTCPLCRAQLLPDGMASCCTGTGTAGTEYDVPEFSDFDYFFPSSPSISSPLQSPIFFQAHQLIGARS